MLTLNCHSVETTYASLASILGVHRGAIDAFLDSCDPEEDWEPDPERRDANVFARFQDRYAPNTQYDATCWFHLTRRPAGTTFEEGLQPLRAALPGLLDWSWTALGESARPDEWEAFAASVADGHGGGGLLRSRALDAYQQGPFGWLVRDFAFYESPKRDYFRRLPEAAEDLFVSIETRFGVDLTQTYLDRSSSFAVTFRTPTSSVACLGTALYYLLVSRRGSGLDSDCGGFQTMRGEAVQPDDILGVEEYQDPPARLPAP